MKVITTLPDALKDWERRHGYNETQAAQHAGIARSTWQRYKSSPGLIPGGQNLIILADVLGMSMGDVLKIAKKDPQVSDEGE